MRQRFSSIIDISLLAGVVTTGAFVMYIVWPIDLITKETHLLATKQIQENHKLILIQYWNDHDFYNTELCIENEGNKIWRQVLDPDARKLWKARLVAREDNIDVYLGGRYDGSLNLSKKIYTVKE